MDFMTQVRCLSALLNKFDPLDKKFNSDASKLNRLISKMIEEENTTFLFLTLNKVRGVM